VCDVEDVRVASLTFAYLRKWMFNLLDFCRTKNCSSCGQEKERKFEVKDNKVDYRLEKDLRTDLKGILKST